MRRLQPMIPTRTLVGAAPAALLSLALAAPLTAGAACEYDPTAPLARVNFFNCLIDGVEQAVTDVADLYAELDDLQAGRGAVFTRWGRQRQPLQGSGTPGAPCCFHQ